MIIAIDGPAGAGKSTTARAVAAALGFTYLDTGAMYRAVALAFLQSGREEDDSGVEAVLSTLHIVLEPGDDGPRVLLNGSDVSDRIREEDVTRMSSRISRKPEVRRFLVAEQRSLAAQVGRSGGGVVMEGRDIGTVVFPDAELKVFLTAEPKTRALRRAVELEQRGAAVDAGVIHRQMEERDRDDSTREMSPLKPADDAVHLDTTQIGFVEQVETIVQLARERR